MINIKIKVPNKYEDLFIKMLKKTSGKSVTLSSDLVNINGKFQFDWKDDNESNQEFTDRAIRAILFGIVEWGQLVKETHRYNIEIQHSTELVNPITVIIPEDILE